MIIESFESMSARNDRLKIRPIKKTQKTEEGRLRIIRSLFSDNGEPYGVRIKEKGKIYLFPHYKALEFMLNSEMKNLINLTIKNSAGN